MYGGSRTGVLVRGPGCGKAGFEAGVSDRKLAVVGDLDSSSVTGPFAYTPGDTVLGTPVEYLCVEQEARYGRLAAEPAPGELEQFFRLDVKTLESARAKRPATTPLGLGCAAGTVRMLGTFLTEEPASVLASWELSRTRVGLG